MTHLTATELAKKLKKKEISTTELVEIYFDAIEKKDPSLNCYLTQCKEEAFKIAEKAQMKINAGDLSPLLGVPISIKDNISTKGIRTTCASKVLENYIPAYDATVVEKLKSHGMIPLGKTNLDEFAMGTSLENSAFGITKNPWNLSRTPGGSSGGSAASVAGNLSPLSLGSDTGGSIRLPASLCGIVGFKPTYGRCSRYGLVAFGSSLDQIGPFGKTVEDAALLAEAITGHDPKEATSLHISPISSRELKNGSLKGLKIALPKEIFEGNIEPGVLKVIGEAIDHLKKQGVEFNEISIPAIKFSVSTYYIIAPAEASSNLARFDGIRYGTTVEEENCHIDRVAKTRGKLFGHEVKQRIMIGTYVLSAGYYDAYYVKAQQIRTQLTEEFRAILKDYDAILNPTSPCVAFKLGKLSADPLALKLLDYCTIAANMGGFPAISINAGYSEELPVGLQLLSNRCEDEKLLQIAYAFEQELSSYLPKKAPPPIESTC